LALVIHRFISQLRSGFSVKYLGARHYFLGIEVSSPSSGTLLLLRQHKYALELLARVGMLKCTPVTTHLASTERLCSTDGDALPTDGATQYRSIVGGLQYLTWIRPDLSFVVNKATYVSTSKIARALHRKKRMVKGFMKPSILTLLIFVTMVDGGYVLSYSR
jgi:hypothetical protein